MLNSERELVKRAAAIAADKQPNGYGKKELIEASKEVFGGYAANPGKKVKSHEEAAHYSNYLSDIDGHYPRGLSTCFSVGISGNCGVDCAQFVDGGCEEPEFDLGDVLEMHGIKDGLEIAESYKEFQDEIKQIKLKLKLS